MKPTITLLMFLSVLCLAVTTPADAIDVTLPWNFFDYTVETPGDPGPDAFYYLDALALGIGEVGDPTRSFTIILDGSGNVKYFRAGSHHNNTMYVPQTGGYANFRGRANTVDGADIYDSSWQIVDVIDAQHPQEPWLLDGHDLIVEEDGSYWTIWREIMIVDMSAIIPGGQEEVEVTGNNIEYWDADHNLLWSWRGFDHLDSLPFTGLHDQQDLYSDSFDHLHVNSIEVMDDVIYLSARHPSLVIKVDRATGDILWRMGGGPLNDFTFIGDADIPLDFNYQHDARFTDSGTMTVFDNGNMHDIQQSYSREYVIDEDSMIVELIWHYVHDPPTYGRMTGSTRRYDNGNTLIGWGNWEPETAATEVDSNNNIVWELSFETDPYTDNIPGTYRVLKYNNFTAEAKPYLVRTRLPDEQFELVCNWFGHEDEVYSYNIYEGTDPAELFLIDSTSTGQYILDDLQTLETYYYQVKAVDENGVEISPWSNMVDLSMYRGGLTLLPTSSTIIPSSGGTLTFNGTLTSELEITVPNVQYWTEVVLPGGQTYGPLTSITFNMPPLADITVTDMAQDVPAFAPPGPYVFVASISKMGYVLSSSFEFEKEGDRSSNSVSSLDISEWPSTYGIWPDGLQLKTSPSETAEQSENIPANFSLSRIAPNPFNERATIELSVPETSEIELAVYDILGREVSTLHRGRIGAGQHRFTLDGSRLSSGVYLVRAAIPGGSVQTAKAVLLR